MSWSTPTTPLPMDINPRVVFERMFGQAGSPAQRAARIRDERSMLDSMTAEARAAAARARHARSRARRASISTTCARSSAASSAPRRATATDVTLDAPVGVPDSFEEHVALMYDLLAVAYQADVTRVFTFMLSRELSQRTYPQIGVTEQHHSVSHHGNDAQKIAQNVKVNTYHVTLFAQFLEKLRSTPDGDGSLLDHSMIVYGGGMGNPNGHASDPLPVRRRRRRRRQGPSARPARSRGRRWATCGWRSRNSTAARIETLRRKHGRVEEFFA